MDKGYQCAQECLSALSYRRKHVRKVPSFDNEEYNMKLSSDRVLEE